MLKKFRTLALRTDLTPFGPQIRAAMQIFLLLTAQSINKCLFIITHLWLTSRPRSELFLPDTDTPGTSREETARMLVDGLEQEPLGYEPSALAIEINSSAQS